MLNILLACN